jgi:hypothetical protein
MRVTSATSVTMRMMVAWLMPKASSPIKASPESLSKMRLCAGVGLVMADFLNFKNWIWL